MQIKTIVASILVFILIITCCYAEEVTPDFTGMNRQQAAMTAGKLGLYLLVAGNAEVSQKVTVTAQNIPKDTVVPLGTTITLEFTDTTARD